MIRVTNLNPEENTEGAEKFETCIHRSKDFTIKKSCCSSLNINGYMCLKREIFPLSYINHCTLCDEYSSIYHNIPLE
jgi:hypothetical protein